MTPPVRLEVRKTVPPARGRITMRRTWLYLAVFAGVTGHGTVAACCVVLYMGNARLRMWK
jgi:hypothetical protein